jgi:hypothetical protein
MNLQTTISIYGGGPGSGCRGTDCGRPKTSSPRIGGNTYGGWITPQGEYVQKERVESHRETAERNGFGTQHGPEDAEDDAKQHGYVRVLSSMKIGRVAFDFVDSPSTRALVLKALDSSDDLTHVDLEMRQTDGVKAKWQENLTVAQARNFLQTGRAPSAVAQWHIQ